MAIFSAGTYSTSPAIYRTRIGLAVHIMRVFTICEQIHIVNSEKLFLLKKRAAMSNDIEQQVIRICERAKHELIALLLSLPVTADPPAVPIQEWMTAKQLAEYWQLVTNDNQPRTAGIMKWANRPADQFPLPHAYMGDLLRFRRDDVNRWAQEEAVRRSDTKMKRLRNETGAHS